MSIWKGDICIAGVADVIPIEQTLTIPTEGWAESVLGQYNYALTMPLPGVTAKDTVEGTITIETEVYAQRAGIALQNESGNGTLTVRAVHIPEGEIQVKYRVVKGDNDGTGQL